MLIFFHSEHVKASREIAATNPPVDQTMTDANRDEMQRYGVYAFPAFVRVDGEAHDTLCDLTPEEAAVALKSFEVVRTAREAARVKAEDDRAAEAAAMERPVPPPAPEPVVNQDGDT